MKLLWSASQLELVVQLNVRKSVSVDGSALSTYDEGVWTSGDTANHVVATNVWLLPALLVIDAVGVWPRPTDQSTCLSFELLRLPPPVGLE